MVREAQISAETAQTAARSAQLSYEMTARSVASMCRNVSTLGIQDREIRWLTMILSASTAGF